jgi:hypothetical protein
MNLIGCSSREAGLVQAALFGEDRGLARVAGQHQGHAHGRLRPLERFGDGRLQQPLAQADAQLPGQDLDHVLGREGVAALQQRGEDAPLAAGPGAASMAAKASATSSEHGREARGPGVRPQRQHVGHGLTPGPKSDRRPRPELRRARRPGG